MRKFKPAPHIEYLLQAEKDTHYKYGGAIRFDRTNSGIVVSCAGYNHQSLYDVEEKLLKLGCKYDVKKGVQEFDRMCGRTFTHFIEPKSGGK